MSDGSDDPAVPARTLSPLDVLLGLMHEKWHAGDHAAAANIAKLAAPYLHPRATAAARTPDPASMSDEELAGWLDGDNA